jgi:hypothetical protein
MICNVSGRLGKPRQAFSNRNLHPVAPTPKSSVTLKSMENKNTSSQLPTALRLGNTVTTDKSTIIENFMKHFSTTGYAFHLATPTPVNSPAPPHSIFPKPPPFLLHPNPDS